MKNGITIKKDQNLNEGHGLSSKWFNYNWLNAAYNGFWGLCLACCWPHALLLKKGQDKASDEVAKMNLFCCSFDWHKKFPFMY